MDLLEYQAKELFREMGIPVLPSQRIDHPKDLKGLKIPYPVVLKSQVRATGRGKAGGINFVENTIDAVAAAQTIFNLPITGEYPEVLLAEAKYDTDKELYLAVVLDQTVRRPVLLGSQQGGTSTESAMEKMQQVVVTDEFSPFYARRLVLKMGLSGILVKSVSAIVEKMYRLFVAKDLDLVEINPLGISRSGEVMALDGKVSANDEAICRHPDLAKLSHKVTCQVSGELSLDTSPDLNFVTLDGNIGILCNGVGLTMATLDLIHLYGGKLGLKAGFVNLGGDARMDFSRDLFCDRLEQGLNLIGKDPNVKAILVNLIGSAIDCELVAEVISAYVQGIPRSAIALRDPLVGSAQDAQGDRGVPAPNSESSVNRSLEEKTYTSNSVDLAPGKPQLIVRLVGNRFAEAKETLAQIKVPLIDNLDEAIQKTVAIVQ
jgi:succinyl-CoA synthetase beta subunit